MLPQVSPTPTVFRRLAFFAVVLCLVSFANTSGIAAAQAPDPSALSKSYGALSLAFEANRGQTAPGISFVAQGDSYSLLIGKSGAVLSLRDSAACKTANSQAGKAAAKCMPRSQQLRMRLIDAGAENTLPARSGGEEATGESLLPGRVNYLIGNDPAKWHTGVPTYQKVRLTQVYPGVDLLYYGNQRRLEYDFEVAPGADPRAIRMHFDDANLKLDPKGNLEIALKDGKVVFERPVIYQNENGGRRTVSGDFRLLDHSTMGFRLGAYDRSRPLIIDPVLSYSTFVDWTSITALAVDASGNAYVTGTASSLLTTTAGAFQGTNNNKTGDGGNAFVTKLDPTGTTALYSTFIGGNGGFPLNGGFPFGLGGDGGTGIAVDSTGNAYLTGFTYSSDFPVKNPLQGQNNAVSNGNDNAFVLELNPTGSALVYSTYLGGSGCGSGAGDGATGLALDVTRAAYIVGTTCSADFPTTPGAYQTSGAVGFVDFDTFVAKISPDGASLVYSTYLGGSSAEDTLGAGIATDSSGNAYVAGTTSAADFPVTPGAYQSSNRAGVGNNVFVTKLNPAGSALVYSTYLGGTGGVIGENNGDTGNAIAVDSAGNAYITGSAGSVDFPVTPGAFQPSDGAALGVMNAFITKLNPTGSALVYSTYLGGSGGTAHKVGVVTSQVGESGNAIAIDSAGNAYVAGSAGSTDFPVTAGAVQTVNHAAAFGNTNAFFAELNPSGTGLLYSTYLGGSGTGAATQLDFATGVAQNGAGNIYLAGVANSADFPVTTGAYQTSGPGSFVSMLNLGAPAASELIIAPASLTVPSPAVGQASAAQTVTLTNGGTGAVTIQNISIGGTNAAEFTQTNTCGATLPAGATCIVSITFTPTVTGSQSASLSIADNAPGSPQSIPLTGIEAVFPPDAIFSVPSLTFPLQADGTISAPQTVTFSNKGKGTLNITSIMLNGSPSTGNAGSSTDSYFAQTNDCGSTLATGASCTFHVTFTPPSGLNGHVNDGISVSDNQAASPQILTLEGNGGVPTMALSATSLTFASQAIGSASSAQIVTLVNAGQSPFGLVPVTITSIAATGDFSETNNCGGTIAASGSCTISVTFTPTATGSRTGTITINDNATGSPQVITLGGTGTEPPVTFSPSSITFPPTPVGSTSAAQTVTFSNPGTTALAVNSFTFTGTNAAEFEIAGKTCNTALAAGASCTLSVAFRPTAAGAAAATFKATDNAANSPQTISLSGSTANLASFLPTSVSFPATAVGSTSAAQIVTFTNTSSTAMSVSSFTFTGTNATEFEIAGKTCITSLAAGASCTLSLAFKPTTAGAATATFKATDNATNSPQTISLSGSTPNLASFSPTSITFPVTAVGSTSAAQIVTFTNTGSTAMSVSSFTFTGTNTAEFEITGKTCNTSLAAGANCTVSLAFKPTAAGAASATFKATDNAANSPQTVALSGSTLTGTTASLSPSTLTFPSTAVGATSAAQTVTFTNTGTAPMAVSSFTFTGTNAAEFLIAGKSCITSLAAGASCTVSLTFKPTATGAAAATFKATDNATNTPQTISLAGTGH